ncbi:hypothetical protein EYF80_028343 [Liparis tanakae]|uniref:Uncharacterized protein n=1 Tax=Liparis tanakae TaxID=230148 RepID=A0A4Z2H9B8_9TELE|nr:hypothetical protein EYF80_028343 [Liparis tanakae]
MLSLVPLVEGEEEKACFIRLAPLQHQSDQTQSHREQERLHGHPAAYCELTRNVLGKVSQAPLKDGPQHIATPRAHFTPKKKKKGKTQTKTTPGSKLLSAASNRDRAGKKRKESREDLQKRSCFPSRQSNSLHQPLITSLVPHYLHLVLTPFSPASDHLASSPLPPPAFKAKARGNLGTNSFSPRLVQTLQNTSFRRSVSLRAASQEAAVLENGVTFGPNLPRRISMTGVHGGHETMAAIQPLQTGTTEMSPCGVASPGGDRHRAAEALDHMSQRLLPVHLSLMQSSYIVLLQWDNKKNYTTTTTQ